MCAAVLYFLPEFQLLCRTIRSQWRCRRFNHSGTTYPPIYAGLKCRRFAATVVRAEPDDSSVQYNKEFGYSRKDVILIGVGLVAFGYALYYGLQAAGVEQLTAGNVTQLIIFVGLCVGWIGSYVYRVANKVRTASIYGCQLRAPVVRELHCCTASRLLISLLHVRVSVAALTAFSRSSRAGRH